MRIVLTTGRILLNLLLLFLPHSVLSQTQDDQTVNITGKVTDSLTSEALEFATVAILEEGSGQALTGTVTDVNGTYTLKNIKAGDYILIANFIGYLNHSVPLQITEGQSKIPTIDFSLTPDVNSLDEVTIESLRPTIVQLADRLVVNIQGSVMAAGNTAFDVLAKSPGIYIDQDGNIQLNGRSGVTLMINDKLTYLSARDLKVMLEGMSAEEIKNIEIITNPSAKYDAEGSSGILNINLTRAVQQGVNGSIYTSYSSNGEQNSYSLGGTVNYKTENWNSYINLDMARRAGGRDVYSNRIFFGEETTYFDQEAKGNTLFAGPPSVRIGTDYSINEKSSLGVMVSYRAPTLETDFLSETFLGNSPGEYHTFIDAENYSRYTFANLTTNIHYVAKLDTLGSSLSADLDYVKTDNSWESDFFNYYDDLTSEGPLVQDFLYTTTPNGLEIFSGKVDYAKSFLKSKSLEMGVKASKVLSENDSKFYFNNDELILDPNRSNHFQYQEEILAAYLNWKQNLGNQFTLQLGLRGENTASRGELFTTGEINEREYFNLFPSVFLQQKVSDNYGINYSYSRRIQRPNYGSLNPFITYRDPYTFWQGNPLLRPQFTNAFGITQVFKKRYSLALSYQLVEDVIAEIPILQEETATTIYTLGNVDNSQNLSLMAVAPLKIMKNWDTNNTATVSYNEFRMMVNQRELINDQISYTFQSNHNILLPRRFKFEMNAVFRGPTVSGLYQVRPVWWINAGLKKSFLNNKLDVTLSANDIFSSNRFVSTVYIENNFSQMGQYFRNRNLGLTLRYNFSKGQKFEAKLRTGGPEEANRM